MKVRELIEALQKLDPELIVICTNACEWTGPVDYVEVEENLHQDHGATGTHVVHISVRD